MRALLSIILVVAGTPAAETVASVIQDQLAMYRSIQSLSCVYRETVRRTAPLLEKTYFPERDLTFVTDREHAFFETPPPLELPPIPKLPGDKQATEQQWRGFLYSLTGQGYALVVKPGRREFLDGNGDLWIRWSDPDIDTGSTMRINEPFELAPPLYPLGWLGIEEGDTITMRRMNLGMLCSESWVEEALGRCGARLLDATAAEARIEVTVKDIEDQADGSWKEVMGARTIYTLTPHDDFAGAMLVSSSEFHPLGSERPTSRTAYTYSKVSDADGVIVALPQRIETTLLSNGAVYERWIAREMAINGEIDESTFVIDPLLAREVIDEITNMRIDPLK